jgi:serine/threonine protein kinase
MRGHGRPDRTPPWGPTASREEARAYVQQRLVLLTKLVLVLFGGMVVFVVALYGQFPATRPERASVVHQSAVAGLVLLAAIWYFALHRRRLGLEALYRIDSLYILLVGAGWGLSAYFASDLRAAIYSAFIWHTFMVFSRVFIVPSTGRRTAIVSGLSYLPLLVAAAALTRNFPERVDLPPSAYLIAAFVFMAAAVVLAANGSRIIYGLRREVSEARQLGQYTLVEKIGEGAMGAVYLAHHAMLRRPCAIKLLPLDKLGVESARRFEREVQHTSQLTHPNTVAIYDYGRSPDGVFYYAMEYLDGIDLETLVRRYGPQPAPRVVHILRQICGALEEAHEAGLTHRDVKPANVLLCRRGLQPDVAKVVDFGLVKAVSPDGTGAGDTAFRGIAGTPAYLAPEAVTDPALVGPHSDLYSLGAVAYYLLSGHRVFDGRSALDVCVQHATAVPVPPSQRTENPIPVGLEALIMACLAKEPADRPASARALGDALDGLGAAWDESLAVAWWRDFAARRDRVPSDTDPTASVVTITVDPAARRGPPSSARPGSNDFLLG